MSCSPSDMWKGLKSLGALPRRTAVDVTCDLDDLNDYFVFQPKVVGANDTLVLGTDEVEDDVIFDEVTEEDIE